MHFRCSDIDLVYGADAGRLEALRGVSFEARDGEFLSIVGPSGCGKTTLMRILAGLLSPTAGRVNKITADGEADRALIVLQELGLFPWMNVIDNACFGLEMQGKPPAERRQAARVLLERFGLADRETAYPGELSSGMKQRVAVVRSFISNPSALLMDEPFGALDYQTRLVLQRELLDLWEQNRTTVVFITHDIDEAILLSDRILLMSSQPGRIIREFPVRLPRPRNTRVSLTGEYQELKQAILDGLGLR